MRRPLGALVLYRNGVGQGGHGCFSLKPDAVFPRVAVAQRGFDDHPKTRRQVAVGVARDDGRDFGGILKSGQGPAFLDEVGEDVGALPVEHGGQVGT